ncbi:HpcH/HpaI aldolase/citrate lyase family protein [Jannaschia rubra]|uniref:Citrate lyase subunit beta-like protein n=1 Tax=Jannaschia rubra TaxID=282197 RepID=A0A0M6XM57_9RHOB|nr:CoA ester lyase [Jannaschia rubra]CTQ31273.1 Citrate lyase subunit beta-like protein [Jannaschia rubra]SFF90339.1 citrate lyase subunit beta / citryl-CoA lyase [Jannaschia rubra]
MERVAAPLCFPLFVPADRPDRFARACEAGTDCVVIDLEDAVPARSKTAVRRIPHGALPDGRTARLWLRINGCGTPWHTDDVAFARAAEFDGVMLPKTESAAEIDTLRAALAPGRTVVALVETVAGLAAIDAIAAAADRVAFGSIDMAEDMGCAHLRSVLLPVRSAIVRAARLACRPAPIDGVTAEVRDAGAAADDAVHAQEMGFGGKLLIHPAQVEPVRAAFRPAPALVDWACRVVDASADGTTVTVDGAMVDAPLVARARRILDRGRELA